MLFRSRIAELPDGRRLSFPEGTPESVIRRTVRRELGAENTSDAVEEMKRAMADFRSASDAQLKRHKDSLSELTDSMSANSSRMTAAIVGELTDVLKGLHKVVASQANVTLKMTEEIAALNRTLDAALGESLEALEQSRGHADDGMAQMATAVNGMNALVHRLATTVESMASVRNARRRATRNPDGSYEFETV